MMDKDIIFRITPDPERAESLLEMSVDRLELLKLIPKNRTYKIVEEYYEIIKELLTAVMYTDGSKTLSHVKLIEYFASRYDTLDENELRLIDQLRKHRNGIVYYGRKLSVDFLENHEDSIKAVISKLSAFVRKRLD